MLRRKAMSLTALLLASPLLAQSQTEKVVTTPPQSAASKEVEQMRSLLVQMQNNLASLPSGYSAMKHQFELEIDMWRMLLNHIERGQDAHSGPHG
jgi:LPS O-antigen subunit length determinant protein (WzzB/FepE family)